LTIGCEPVFHARRLGGENFPLHNAVSFEFAELLREHFLGSVCHKLAKFAVSFLAVHQMVEDDGFPFSADDIKGGPNGAIFKTHGFQAYF
jgi:hypothetical protein